MLMMWFCCFKCLTGCLWWFRTHTGSSGQHQQGPVSIVMTSSVALLDKIVIIVSQYLICGTHKPPYKWPQNAEMAKIKLLPSVWGEPSDLQSIDTTHVSHVQAKLSKSSAIVGKTRHILDHKSLFLAYLSHCVEVWGNITRALCSRHAQFRKKQCGQ